MIQAPVHTDERVIFRETFNSEQETIRNGGTPADVAYSNGVGTLPGTANNGIVYPYTSGLASISESDFSVRVRVRVRDNGTTNACICCTGDLGGTNYGWGLSYINTSNVFYFQIRDATGISSLAGQISVDYDEWVEVVACRSYGGTSYLYINGVAESNTISESRDASPNSNSGISFKVGLEDPSPSFENEGDYDFIEVYKYALSAEEVSNLYNGKTYKEIGHDSILEVSALSGTPVDRMGATLTNTGVWVAKNPAGRVMYFDGTADLDLGQTYTLSRQSATIEVWFRASEIANDRYLIANDESGFKYIGFNNLNIRLESNTNADEWLSYAYSNLSENIWYHLLIVADNGTVNSYLNGVLIDTTTPADDVTFQYIGSRSLGARYWLGYIGKVRFWNRALSVAEGTQLFTNERRRYRV